MKILSYSDLYRIVSGMRGFPKNRFELRDFFSVIMFVSALAPGRIREYFGMPLYKTSIRDPQLRAMIIVSLRESILFLSTALKLFPEESFLDLVEELLDLLLDVASLPDLRVIVTEMKQVLLGSKLLIGGPNGQS